MKVFIVYWHPEPQSFNNAMFKTAIEIFENQGHEVKTSDLHAMNFDPVSSRKNFKTVNDDTYLKLQLEELHATRTNTFADEIENEIQKMEWCDLMIWQFPIWWLGLPAVFKGWVDRVYPLGRCYSHSKSFENGVFKGKKAMVSVTTGGSADAYKSGGMMGDILSLLKPMHYGMMRFVGYSVLSPHLVYAPVRMSDEEREQELIKYKDRLGNIEQEVPLEIKGF